MHPSLKRDACIANHMASEDERHVEEKDDDVVKTTTTTTKPDGDGRKRSIGETNQDDDVKKHQKDDADDASKRAKTTTRADDDEDDDGKVSVPPPPPPPPGDDAEDAKDKEKDDDDETATRGFNANAALTKEEEEPTDADEPYPCYGEDPAVTAARNAAARGPTEEELENARKAEEERRAEEERANAVTTRVIDCPASMVGRIIGRGGETIKGLQASSGAHVAIDQNVPDGEPRKINISGAVSCVECASRLVENLLLGTGAAGSLLVTPGQTSKSVECPKESVGKLIGRGGETIRGIQMATGARMQIDQTRQPCQVVMAGTDACVEACVQVVQEIIEGGSTAVFNEIARGGQGFGGQGYGGQATMAAGWGGQAASYDSAAAAAYDPAAYAQQQAVYAQMYAAQQYGAHVAATATAAATGTPAPTNASAAPAATPVWRAIDDGKGNVYWYNTLTGVSQWEKPSAN
jgi:far upstream element-binding protein